MRDRREVIIYVFAFEWNRNQLAEATVGLQVSLICVGNYKLKPGWNNDDDNKYINGWSFFGFCCLAIDNV